MMELTRDDILNIEAGREMDALIARHVFDLVVSWWSIHPPEAYNVNMRFRTCASDEVLLPDKDGDMPILEWCDEGEWFGVAHYSTDIAEAWQVVEEAHKEFYCSVTIRRHVIGSADPRSIVPLYTAYLDHSNADGWIVRAQANTAPEAICKVALLATLEAQE